MSFITNSIDLRPPLKKQKLEQKVEKSHVESIPIELLFRIFEFLSPKDLVQTSCVCWKWNAVASHPFVWEHFDIKKRYPSVNFIDENVWETHVDLPALGLSFDDAPPLNKRTTILALNKLSSLDREGDAGITFITIPKGHSLNKLKQFIVAPKQGNATCFRFIWKPIEETFGDILVDKTFRVVLTNAPLVGSRKMVVRDHRKLLKKMGCEMPELLPMATLPFLTYISSQETPPTRVWYSNNIQAQTSVSENIGKYILVVGNYLPNGLTAKCFFHTCASNDFGVGAQLSL